MEVTHKAACMVNHRHEKLLSYVKRKHGRTSRSPVCVTAAVEKVDSHLCLLHCGFGPFGFCRTLAYRHSFHRNQWLEWVESGWWAHSQSFVSFCACRLTYGSISDCVVMQFLFGFVAQPVCLSWHSWCFHEAFMCIQSRCLLFQINWRKFSLNDTWQKT